MWCVEIESSSSKATDNQQAEETTTRHESEISRGQMAGGDPRIVRSRFAQIVELHPIGACMACDFAPIAQREV
ncbi:MAG: hypothetical protein MHMPM18_001084 [Marteilia pararefringens]